MKPYYKTELGELYCGDCLEIMKQFPDKYFDLCLTDPPYGVIGHLKNCKWDDIDIIRFTNQWWSLSIKKLNPNGTAYVFFSQKYIKEGFEIFNPERMLIWHHPNLAKPTNKMFLWTYDPIFYVKFEKSIFNASFCNSDNIDVFKYAKPQNNFKKDKRFHPCSKPLRLIERFIKISSNRGGIIFDPFLGSGTTAVACEILNRRWIGIEISEKYCEIAKQRIMAEANQGKLSL